MFGTSMKIGLLLILCTAALLSCGEHMMPSTSHAGRSVTLSNVSLPQDTAGHQLITGEASVLAWNGAYYVYFDDWGDCPGVDCCPSRLGCADCCFNPPTAQYPDNCVYANGHTVIVYRTVDFESWEPKGVALPLANRKDGIMFRPHVIYRASTNSFLMWYIDRWEGQTGYAIAEGPTPEGPFVTIADSVNLHGAGRIGDFYVFIDDDGTAYHARTGLNIEKLTADFTAGTGEYYSLFLPFVEGPVMFKRDGRYYLVAGADCCACAGGTNMLVYTADHPLGPYTFQSDVGSYPSPFDPHVPDHYVTRAQASDVVQVRAADGSLQFLWLGNQWVTAAGPDHSHNHDLLYWSLLQFDGDGRIQPVVRQDTVTLSLP